MSYYRFPTDVKCQAVARDTGERCQAFARNGSRWCGLHWASETRREHEEYQEVKLYHEESA